jgi:hypothetical protein
MELGYKGQGYKGQHKIREIRKTLLETILLRK